MFRSSGSDRFSPKQDGSTKKQQRFPIKQQKFSSKQAKFSSKQIHNKSCCCIEQYEQQISILQQKLMQTHNKLIEQLDICQQQELSIIDLTKKLLRYSQVDNQKNTMNSCSFASSQNNGDVSNEEQSMNDSIKQNFYRDQAVDFTLNNSGQLLLNMNSNYNSPTFMQNNRNQLLKTDLQAMRLKLVQQITQKSKIKQQLSQLRTIHTQKIGQYKKQIKDLQHDHQYLLKQYQYIKSNLQKSNIKKNSSFQQKFSSSQFMELNEKCNQFERLYKKQIALNQQLNQKIGEYKLQITSHRNKIKQLQTEIDKYNHCVKSTSTAADGLKEQRDRDDICGTIRMSRTPGTLWEKDSNKKSISNSNFTDTEMFKKRGTVTGLQIGRQTKQNKQNVLQSFGSGNKKYTALSEQPFNSNNTKQRKIKNTKEDYQSTKQLIKKLQETQMMTRQRKRSVMG